MANVHVIAGGQPGTVRLVCHIATPSISSQANPALTDAQAVLRSGQGGTTILPDGDGNGGTISTAEKNEIIAGTKFERAVDWDLGNDFDQLTGPQQLAKLDDKYNQISADERTRLQRMLRWFGRVR